MSGWVHSRIVTVVCQVVVSVGVPFMVRANSVGDHRCELDRLVDVVSIVVGKIVGHWLKVSLRIVRLEIVFH